MLKVLFIGDINAKIGRRAIKKILPGLKRKLKPDLVIANAENLAHGTGVTESTLKEVMGAGVDWFTNGDHAFDQEKYLNIYSDQNLPILRPANYSSAAPGQGYTIIDEKKYKILLINLVGRVFMGMHYDCPFKKLDEILSRYDGANLDKKNLSAIIVDIHAEATAEKIALGHYMDGRVSAILGTHTHVMTADHKITKRGTAYITDVGMVGFADGCIGIDKENIIKTFLTQIKYRHIIPEEGRAVFNAVFTIINPKTRKATKITPIIKYIEIK
jgi:hypothetical protein